MPTPTPRADQLVIDATRKLRAELELLPAKAITFELMSSQKFAPLKPTARKIAKLLSDAASLANDMEKQMNRLM